MPGAIRMIARVINKNKYLNQENAVANKNRYVLNMGWCVGKIFFFKNGNYFNIESLCNRKIS